MCEKEGCSFPKYTKYAERIEDLGYSIIEASYLECEHNVAKPQDNFEDFLHELRQTETDEVYLDKGVHAIKFIYRPISFEIGASITVLTLMALIGLFILYVYRKKASQ